MNYPDFSFPKDTPSYLHHTLVLKYLNDYAKYFNLLPRVRFQTKVLSVEPLMVVDGESKEDDNFSDSKWCQWSVQYQQDGCEAQSEEFDAVVVCNGYEY